MTPDNIAIEAKVIASLAQLQPTSSLCPSDVARALAPHDEIAWRSLMPKIRHVLAAMIAGERIVVTRGRRTLTIEEFEGGPIRIRRGPQF